MGQTYDYRPVPWMVPGGRCGTAGGQLGPLPVLIKTQTFGEGLWAFHTSIKPRHDLFGTAIGLLRNGQGWCQGPGDFTPQPEFSS